MWSRRAFDRIYLYLPRLSSFWRPHAYVRTAAMQTWHVRTLLNRHAGLKFARRNNTRTRDISSSTRRDNVNNPDSKIPPFSRSAFRFTEPPDPSWKIGDGANEAEGAGSWKKGEEAGWKTWNLADTPSGCVTSLRNYTFFDSVIDFCAGLRIVYSRARSFRDRSRLYRLFHLTASQILLHLGT